MDRKHDFETDEICSEKVSDESKKKRQDYVRSLSAL